MGVQKYTCRIRDVSEEQGTAQSNIAKIRFVIRHLALFLAIFYLLALLWLDGTPDAVAQPACPSPDLTLSLSEAYWASYADYTNRFLTAVVTISNSGIGEAQAVTAEWNSSTGGAAIATPLPATVAANIVPGGSIEAGFRFRVLTGTLLFRTSFYVSAGDSCGGIHRFPQGSWPLPETPPPPSIMPLTPGTSWQWQLPTPVDETVLDAIPNPKKMYDIDVFDNSAQVVSRIHAKGITVIGYISVGSAEDWRPDYNELLPAAGNDYDGWPGEKWLDIRNLVVKEVMLKRLDLAKSKGFDGIEPDNMDGYDNNTGFPLTYADQLSFNLWLAAEAHARGMSIGQKNAMGMTNDLAGAYDWALNEEGYQYDDPLEVYSVYIAQNKAVFGVEYAGSTSSFCPQANAVNYDWLKKDVDLTAYRVACREGN